MLQNIITFFSTIYKNIILRNGAAPIMITAAIVVEGNSSSFSIPKIYDARTKSRISIKGNT